LSSRVTNVDEYILKAADGFKDQSVI